MKTALSSKLLILSVAIGLTGCSGYNSQEVGPATGVGVVAGALVGGVAGAALGHGAAIAAGAVAGGLIGGAIGYNMDSNDRAHAYSAVESGTPSTWTNQRTHYVYYVYPSKHYYSMQGYHHCRDYVTTVRMGEHVKKVHGVACRADNGEWVAVK